MINQYPIADIQEWIEKRTLIGDPTLESYDDPPEPIRNRLLTTVIDRGLIPPIYVGMTSNVATMKSIRTVYRGGILVRILNDFVHNRTFLHGPFGPVSFNTLPSNTQQTFLAYQVPVFEISGTSKHGIQKLIEHVGFLSTSKIKQTRKAK